MIILPARTDDTVADVARQLLDLITMEASILFVVLGASDEARLLGRLAEEQTDTGGVAGWTRKVVWVQTPEAVADPSLAPYISPVSPGDLGFTIGFSDRVGRAFHPGDAITAGRVFMAYRAAEKQALDGGTA